MIFFQLLNRIFPMVFKFLLMPQGRPVRTKVSHIPKRGTTHFRQNRFNPYQATSLNTSLQMRKVLRQRTFALVGGAEVSPESTPQCKSSKGCLQEEEASMTPHNSPSTDAG